MGIVGGTANLKEISPEELSASDVAMEEASSTAAVAAAVDPTAINNEEDFQQLLHRAKLLTLKLAKESGECICCCFNNIFVLRRRA